MKHQVTRLFLLSLGAIALLLLSSSPLAAQEGAPAGQRPDCTAEEHRQFDFWIGEWRVESRDGSHAGDNTITKSLNGCVLEENWRGVGGSIGKSLNMYWRRDGKWRQSWVDGTGGRLDLIGGLEDGVMVMGMETTGRDGGAVVHEIRWTPQEDGSVTQEWRATTDGGKSWTEQFYGIYKAVEP